jgi:hypothetical protein
MDPDLVAQGLAVQAATIVTPDGGKLRGLDYLADTINPPVFIVGDIQIDYLQTFGTEDAYTITCRLLISRADDRAGQRALRPYMKRTGQQSIKATLEANPTLGGLCDDLVVKTAHGPRIFTVAANEYYGTEFVVFVIGD